MGKVDEGLLHEALLSAIAGRSRNGCVTILFAPLPAGDAAAARVASEWERREPGLFWKQRLDAGMLYWLHHLDGYATAAQVESRVSEQFRELLSAEGSTGSPFGYGGAVLAGFGAAQMITQPSRDAAEAELIRCMMEAMERGNRGRRTLRREPAEVSPMIAGSASSYTIGSLASEAPLFDSDAKVSEVSRLFDTHSNVQGAIVVKDRRPLGVIMRDRLYQQLAGQFGYALYSSRSVEKIMIRDPLIVEEHTPVERVSQLAMSREDSQLYDIVVTVKDGRVSGAATIRDILECMTALRTEEARTASPLTGLPGNAGIEAELSRRIASRKPFAVVYADLDYFKWFNDYFGFARGDELIRFLADLMVAEFASCGSHSFVGHIGGDDFIGVVDPSCVDSVCERRIESCDEGVHRFDGGTDITVVENHQGHKSEQSGVTLSLSMLQCDGSGGMALEDISICAARLKKRAKSISGSVCVAGVWDNSQPREK
ncbi:MAG: RNase stability modulator [Paenibacillus sp.]|nr:RNase stability modulator [Paenibacillus sp.]